MRDPSQGCLPPVVRLFRTTLLPVRAVAVVTHSALDRAEYPFLEAIDGRGVAAGSARACFPHYRCTCNARSTLFEHPIRHEHPPPRDSALRVAWTWAPLLPGHGDHRHLVRKVLAATVSCSPVRRRGRPSSLPFALAASRPALVRRLMLWRSWLAT